MLTAERNGFSEIRVHAESFLARILAESQGSPPVDPHPLPSLNVFDRFTTQQLRTIGLFRRGGEMVINSRYWPGQEDSHSCVIEIEHCPIDGEGSVTKQPTDRFVNRMTVSWYSPSSELDLVLTTIQEERPKLQLLHIVTIANRQKSVELRLVS